MILFRVLANKLKYAFTWLIRKPHLKNTTQEHWVNHIYNETRWWPDGQIHWANIHGFDEGPGQTYWVGVDYRYLGIRIEDYVLKFKNKSTYDEYVNLCPEDFLKKMKSDSRMDMKYGGNVDTYFVFKWGGEEKTFNVRLDSDRYAEEK